MAKKTLESFINDYVKNRILSGEALGYADYVNTKFSDRNREYGKAQREISAKAISEKPTYGSLGELLSKKGLTGSGYADYLSEKSIKKTPSDSLGIRADYEAKGARADASYRSYLEKLAGEADSLYESVEKKLTAAHLVDYDKAYDMALEAGLYGKYAEELARSVTDKERAEVREQVVSEMLEKGFTEEQTYRYALSRGLSYQDAKELKLVARRLNESVASEDESKTFLDYLRELRNNNN